LTQITGHKFFDKDMDGVWDAGEPGLGGWTVTLEKETAPGVWTLEGTTVTDPTGMYDFKWLLPGTYRVNEILMPGWAPTSSLPQIIVIPSPAVTHPTLPVTIVSNIGNVMYGSICGYKFEDLVGPLGEYPNGVKDANEYGIGNWEIKLDGRQVNGVHVSITLYTNNIGPLVDIGKYLFANLLPGVYWVNETEFPNWVPTTTSVAKLTLSAYPFWPVNLMQNFGNMHPADPTMNFVLKPGMNIWSTPLQKTVQIRASELAAAIGSSCLMISKWNTTTKAWQSFIVGFTHANTNLDFRLQNGQGYYIVSKVFTSFQLEGDLVTGAQINLAAGINVIGFSTLKPMAASDFVKLVSLQSGKVKLVSMLGSDNKWQSYIPGFTPINSAYNFAMSQGHAYLVYTDGPGVVSFPAA
jgi:hypothetical protein